MTDKELKLINGALLHDIGKIIYRAGEKRKHSDLGYDFLKNEVGINDTDILQCVKYHHGDAISRADLKNDALAYIVYVADNIAAASDRREKATDEKGFDLKIPLQSVFNILNGNKENKWYLPKDLEESQEINMPTEKRIDFDSFFYQRVQEKLLYSLEGIENCDDAYVNSLLSVLEAYLTYIPSSTAVSELADISLYDHVKMTAAYSSCIYQFMCEKGVLDYKEYLYRDAKEFYEKKAFLLCSMDMSGIQSFIYTIHSEGALRMLRSRSFYLEILMECIIDEILDVIGLSRANLIYTGGGHCYLLLPNTIEVKKRLEQIESELGDWFLETYDISLYIAMAYVECSAYDLENQPKGSYSDIFHEISQKLSVKKAKRYTAKQIIRLNKQTNREIGRECKICKASVRLRESEICPLCENLKKFSTDILYQTFFTVHYGQKGGLPLPYGKSLVAQSEDEVRHSIETDDSYVRTYGKNCFYTGNGVQTKLWVGDYTQKGKTTDIYAKEAEGIDRIAVLRADVDDLGKAFVSGFPQEYTTLSRTATFSRQLSLFFKHHINYILSHGEFTIKELRKKRNATIVYSGGDDVFIIGSWNDVVELAVDIQKKLEKFSQGTLSISAGIGLYDSHYPLGVSAKEVGKLEDKAKEYPDIENPQKNAVTIFDTTYSWKIFEDKVVGEKLKLLKYFYNGNDEKGKAFLYRLLELIRERDEKINWARLAYLLARLEPQENAKAETKEQYWEFTKQIYEWMQSDEDSKQLITAIYLYVYQIREGGETE